MPPTHLLRQQDPPHLTAVHLDPPGPGGLDQAVQRPLRRPVLVSGVQVPASGALRAARRIRAGQRDDATPVMLAQPPRPSRLSAYHPTRPDPRR